MLRKPNGYYSNGLGFLKVVNAGDTAESLGQDFQLDRESGRLDAEAGIGELTQLARGTRERGIRGALYLVVAPPEWESGALCAHREGEGPSRHDLMGAAAPFLCAQCIATPEYLDHMLLDDRYMIWGADGRPQAG